MRPRHWIYAIVFFVYFIFWGLVPLGVDPFYSFFGHAFCISSVVRSFPAIIGSAIIGFCAIEAIFILKRKLKNNALWFLSGFALISLSAASFFISGQNLELSCNAERVTERLWFFKLRDVVVEDQNAEPVSIIHNYTDEGCFRYYHYLNQNYKVFRGLGFAFNLCEVAH